MHCIELFGINAFILHFFILYSYFLLQLMSPATTVKSNLLTLQRFSILLVNILAIDGNRNSDNSVRAATNYFFLIVRNPQMRPKIKGSVSDGLYDERLGPARVKDITQHLHTNLLNRRICLQVMQLVTTIHRELQGVERLASRIMSCRAYYSYGM